MTPLMTSVKAKEHHTPNAGTSGELTRRQTDSSIPKRPPCILYNPSTPMLHLSISVPWGNCSPAVTLTKGEFCFWKCLLCFIFTSPATSTQNRAEVFPGPPSPLHCPHPMLPAAGSVGSAESQLWGHGSSNSGLLIPTSHRFHHLPHINGKRRRPEQPPLCSPPPAALPLKLFPVQTSPCRPPHSDLPLQTSPCSSSHCSPPCCRPPHCSHPPAALPTAALSLQPSPAAFPLQPSPLQPSLCSPPPVPLA